MTGLRSDAQGESTPEMPSMERTEATGAKAFYERHREQWQAEVRRHSRVARALSTARVVVFLLVSLFVVLAYRGLGARGALLAAVSFLVFVVLVLVHDRVHRRQRWCELSARWADVGLRRLEGLAEPESEAFEPAFGGRDEDGGAVRALPESRQGRDGAAAAAGAPRAPVGDEHAYAKDLDLFGPRSLFAMLDTTRTQLGRARLAAWLCAPAAPQTVAQRQEAARELVDHTTLRSALWVEGALLARDPPDAKPMLQWCLQQERRWPWWVRAGALLLPPLALALLFFGPAMSVPRVTWVVPFLLELGLLFWARERVRLAMAAIDRHHEGLPRYAAMLQLLEAMEPRSAALTALRAPLLEGTALSSELRTLSRIVGFADARRNDVWRIFIGPILLWDLHTTAALERWRERAGRRFAVAMETLAEAEALAALAARAFDYPSDAWPEVRAAAHGEPHFVAEQLAHPLLATDRAVANDVRLDGANRVWLVTGSNMSGKSTLLRAIGCNAVLAQAGAPVRAHSLHMSPMQVWTSMRIADSLNRGVSLFQAELLRLRDVVAAAKRASADVEGPAQLYLLDEILHGTNSRERHIGARSVVLALAKERAIGAVSTHDLALAALRDVTQGVSLVHFREDVAQVEGKETMTFDYQLRPGVVTSSNALRLMRMVGLEVPPEAIDG